MIDENSDYKLRTIIVDDEPLAIERLQILCAPISPLDIIATATDGASALRLNENLKPDLILLDITMPIMDGIETAKQLARLEHKPSVIFITAFDNFALEAFDLDVVDYVLKPVASERLERAIARVIESRKDNVFMSEKSQYAQEFWVSHRNELIRIAAIDIDHVEAERDYMRLHLGNRSYLLHQTISSLEQRLDPAMFQRIHRSHILRKDIINGLRHEGGGVWHVLLRDGQSLRIGRKYLADVKTLAGK